MGGGRWDVGTYTSHVDTTRAAGRSTFDYSDGIRAGRYSTTVHELLDPKRVAGPTSPFAGKVMREVVISDEHPNPTPIALVLDVTGSNYGAAVKVHAKLPQLLGVLQRRGYVEDPQLNFCATGDANSDRVPLQMGAFESDNRIDLQLEAMYLEGGGGGGMHETYELAAYFLARHTNLEPLEKQGRKGFAFFIGDEKPYDMVRRSQVRDLIGDDLQADIPTEEIFRELQEKFEVFFLFQAQGSYSESEVLPKWRKLLGERALVLDDPDAVCEFIAGVLGMLEAGLDVDEIEEDLIALGADRKAVGVAGKALAKVGGGGAVVAKTDGNLPDVSGSTGTSRL
jgi:hypothetical protein